MASWWRSWTDGSTSPRCNGARRDRCLSWRSTSWRIDLRPLPYRTRRARLEQVLAGAGPGLALMPSTDDAAAATTWLAQHGNGIEGVVAKPLDDPYRPGQRWWSKVKVRATVEVVVGGVIGSLEVPRALILGRYDEGGRFRIVGRTVPLSQTAATSLSLVLRLPPGEHPWPELLPAGWFGGGTLTRSPTSRSTHQWSSRWRWIPRSSTVGGGIRFASSDTGLIFAYQMFGRSRLRRAGVRKST